MSQHEKISESISTMLLHDKLPFYGFFLLSVDKYASDLYPVGAVNATKNGLNLYYSEEYVNNATQKEVNFVLMHLTFHLLFEHHLRDKDLDIALANIAQDMIINHILVQDVFVIGNDEPFIEVPKDSDGKNMALFIPKQYKGMLMFEDLYLWLKKEKEIHDKNPQTKNIKQMVVDGVVLMIPDPNLDSHGKPAYGPYGQNPHAERKGGTIDTYSLTKLFDNINNNELGGGGVAGEGIGEYMDSHISDTMSKEYRSSLVEAAIHSAKMRSPTGTTDVGETLDKLRKKREDHLKYIKRAVENFVFGSEKQKSITKANRRGIKGLKGHKKIKMAINCILDTSGSMTGMFEEVLSYIFRREIEVNMVQIDTEVKEVRTIKNINELKRVDIIGHGGTFLQPGMDYIRQHLNHLSTVILTDGYTDMLDLTGIKGRVLIISVGTEVPILKTNGKVKQKVVPANSY